MTETDRPQRPSGDQDGGPRPEGWFRSSEGRVVRRIALAGLAALAVWAVATGGVGWLFGALVLLPLGVAMAGAEWDRPELSAGARVATVGGLVAWLSLTGGLPMVLVVATVVAMIFLHELGHYLAARWSGMKATEFFLGFGTKLWSFRRGETEFGLKAIPAGAYVKIIGMNNLEEVDPADEPRTYRQASFRDRMGVAVAGSAMHFAIALVLLVVQFSFIGRADDTRWTVGSVTEGSAAAVAGVEEGDRLVAFAGRPVGTFEEFRDTIRALPAGPTELVVQRGGAEQILTLDLARRTKVIGTVGEDLDLIESGGAVTVGPTRTNGRVERAGLAEGDEVVAINGVGVTSIEDVPNAVAGSTGGTVVVSTRGNPEVEVPLGSEVATTEPTAFFGVGGAADLVTQPVHSAAGSAVAEFGRGVGASVAGIGMVFWPPNLLEFLGSTVTGSDRDVAEGPTPAEDVAYSSDAGRPMSIIGAVAFGADLTAENMSNLVGFMIGLNIFIGVFNLIPLLPFDGGHVAIAVYEKAQELRRRQRNRYIADVTRMIPVAYTVVMVLVVVGLLAMYLDITRGVSA